VQFLFQNLVAMATLFNYIQH